ncbi:hypothetical protein H4R34_006145, partial [Dimargaris verticillata]
MLKIEDDLLEEFKAMVQSEQGELQDSQDVASTDQAPAAIAGSVPDEPQENQGVVSTDQTEETIVGSVPDEPQGNQTVVLPDQKQKAAALALTKKYRAFMNWFWLEVIGGGEKKRLSYYLSNMLAFDVIPRIIGQALESGSRDNNGNYGTALEIAKEISKLPDFFEFVKECKLLSPNYFEFIMLYATTRNLKNRDMLLRDARKQGNVDASFLYNCFNWPIKRSLADGWKDIFGINELEHGLPWPLQNFKR